mmetsp:Transcript_15822/g.19296  ORF Transcript_15822/g.19296 Transcript_15822/m.19296 type:complete len:215 (-) Transcript_15822:365-1009(-)
MLHKPTNRLFPSCVRIDDIFHSQQLDLQNIKQNNKCICNTSNCGGMRFQGLQEIWRWTKIGKVSQHCVGGEGTSWYNQSGRMRVSGRMWLWTKSCHRWKNCQFSERPRCSGKGAGSARRINTISITTNLNTGSTLFRLFLLIYMLSNTLILNVYGFGSIGSFGFVDCRISRIQSTVHYTKFIVRRCLSDENGMSNNESEENNNEKDDDDDRHRY